MSLLGPCHGFLSQWCKMVLQPTSVSQPLFAADVRCSAFQQSPMPIRHIVKDLDIVGAATAGMFLPLMRVAQQRYADVCQEGYADWDLAVMHMVLGLQGTQNEWNPRLGVSDTQWGF